MSHYTEGRKWCDRYKAWVFEESWEADELKRLQNTNRELIDALLHLHHNAKRSGEDRGLALDVAEQAIKKAVGGK